MASDMAVLDLTSKKSGLASVLCRGLLTDLRWLDGMSWRKFAFFLLGIAALSIFSVPSAIFWFGRGFDARFDEYVEAFLDWYWLNLWRFFPAFMAVTIVDRLMQKRRWRRLALSAALVLATLLVWPLTCVVLDVPMFLDPPEMCATFPSWASWLLFVRDAPTYMLPIGGVVAIALFSARHDREMARALHAAELARIETHRRTLGADLQAMQARVDPAFFLATLDEVGRLYETDADAADRMVDALTAFLRASLSDGAEATSALGVQLVLARNYVSLLNARQVTAVRLAVDVLDDLESAQFPPLILLPAIDHLRTRARNADGELRVRGEIRETRLRVTVSLRGGFVPEQEDDALAALRQRLIALCGESATLDLRRHEFAAEVVVVIALERANQTSAAEA